MPAGFAAVPVTAAVALFSLLACVTGSMPAGDRADAPDETTSKTARRAAALPDQIVPGDPAELRLKSGHAGPVSAIAFSSNGDRLVSAGEDGAIRIWDLDSGFTIRTLDDGSVHIRDVAITHDGRTIASAGSPARVWDTRSGLTVAALPQDGMAVAFSPDDATLAVRHRNHTAVYDARSASYTELARWPMARTGTDCRSLEYSPDGRRLVTGCGDDQPWLIIDTTTWQIERQLPVPAGTKSLLAKFDPRGAKLALSHDRTRVRIVDVSTGKVIVATTKAGAYWVSLSWSPAGSELLLGENSGLMSVWTPDSSDQGRIPPAPLWRFAAAGEGTSQAGRQPSSGMRVHAAGPHGLVAGAMQARTVEVLDRTGARRPLTLGPGELALDNVVAIDEQRFATAGLDGLVRVWDLTRLRVAFVLDAHENHVTALAVSADGTTLISGSRDGTVRMWDLASGALLSTLTTGGTVTSISTSAEEIVALVTDIGRARLVVIDPSTHSRRSEVSVPNLSPFGRPRLVALPTPGQILLTHTNRSLELWNVRTGSREASYDVGLAFVGSPIALSPDGKRVLFHGGKNISATVQELELATGNVVNLMPNRIISGGVGALAYRPDGKALFVATGARIERWTVEKPQKQHVYDGHEGAVAGLATLPGRQRFVSVSADGTARLWNANRQPQTRVVALSERAPDRVVWSANQQWLAAWSDYGSNSFRLVGPDGKANAPTIDGRVLSAVFITPSLVALATDTRRDDGTYAVELRSVPSGTVERIWTHEKPIHNLGVRTAAGELIAIDVTGRLLTVALEDLTVRLDKPGALPGYALRLSVSPDEELLAAVLGTGKVTLLHPATGGEIASVDASASAPIALSNTTLVFVDDKERCAVWHRDETTLRGPWVLHPPRSIDAVAISSDGSTALTIGKRGTGRQALRWNTATGRVLDRWQLDDGLSRIADVRIADAGFTATLLSNGLGVARMSRSAPEWLAMFAEGNQWVIFSPQGWFDASSGGGELLGTVVDERVFYVDQFAVERNRPDVLMTRFDVGTPAAADHLRLLAARRLAKLGLAPEDLTAGRPEVAIVGSRTEEKGALRLAVSAQSNGSPLAILDVYVNNVIQTNLTSRLSGDSANTDDVVVTLTEGTNKIEVAVTDERGRQSLRAVTHAFLPPPGDRGEAHDFEQPINAVVFDPDGQFVLLRTQDGRIARLEIDGKLQWLTQLTESQAINSLTLSPDGHTLAAAGCHIGPRAQCREGLVLLIDLRSGKERRLTAVGLVAQVVFAPDGKTLLTLGMGASGWHSVRAWDIASRTVIGEERIPTDTRFNVQPAIAPNGKTLVAVGCNAEGTTVFGPCTKPLIHRWTVNVTSGTASFDAQPPISAHDYEITGITFTAESQLLTSSVDGTLGVWDLAASKRIATFSGQAPRPKTVNLSPEAERRLSAFGSAPDTYAIWGLALSGDGRFVATQANDGRTHLWSFDDRRVVRTFDLFNLFGRPIALDREASLMAIASQRRLEIVDLEKGVNARADLYYLGFGVSDYEDDNLDLGLAHKDAIDLERAMAGQTRRYDNVYTRVYINKQVTRDTVAQARTFLAPARPRDTVVVFLAGHGVHDDSVPPVYYYLTHETDLKDLPNTAAPFDEIEALVSDIAPRNKLLLIDTCESGERDAADPPPLALPRSDGRARAIPQRGVKNATSTSSDLASQRGIPPFVAERDRFVHRDLRRRSGTIVLSAARGTEYSYESPRLGNGYFTHAILEALTTWSADTDQNSVVSTDELRRFVAARVAKNTGDKQHPTVDRDNIYQKFAFAVAEPGDPTALPRGPAGVDDSGRAVGLPEVPPAQRGCQCHLVQDPPTYTGWLIAGGFLLLVRCARRRAAPQLNP